MSSKPPKPSLEERALQGEQAQMLREQRAILQQQLRDQNLLMPQLLAGQGLEAVRDAQGNITEYRLTSEAQQRKATEQRLLDLSLADVEARAQASPQEQEIQRLQRERVLAGLKGELPVDPGLMRSLGEQETVLRDQLRANLGTGFETSTPGIQTLAEFGKRRNEIIEGARRADITLGEQMRLASEAGAVGKGTSTLDITERLRQSRLGDIFNTSQLRLPTAGAFGSGAQGFGNAAAMLGQQRLTASQIRAQENAGYAQAGGTALGAYLGYLALA